MPTTLIVASNHVPEAHIPNVMIASEVVETNILIPTPKMDEPTTIIVDLSARGLSPSPSPTKWGWDVSPSTPIEGGSTKRDLLAEGGEHDALTHFFWIPSILPSWVPSPLKEFTTVVVVEDLDFVWSLCTTDRRRFLNLFPILYSRPCLYLYYIC